jgi:hypothetical protein
LARSLPKISELGIFFSAGYISVYNSSRTN